MSNIIVRPDIWYFPANYGDIRLEAVDENRTKVIWFRLTAEERKAMEGLKKSSTTRRRLKRWATPDDWANIGEAAFSLGDPTERSIELRAPLTDVGGVLTRVLRTDREQVHVMRIGDGKIEEFRGFEAGAPEESEAEVVDLEAKKQEKTDASEAAAQEKADEPEETALARTGTDGGVPAVVAKEDKAPVKAATVKKPRLGCPVPTFDEVKTRATRVLQAFLNPEQVEDFNRHQRFVTRGADTGHLYMLTSRNAPDEIKNYGSRCVFDLDDNRAYCVHDYDVPAEEELLALHCLLSMPGYENWARAMPDHGLHPAIV